MTFKTILIGVGGLAAGYALARTVEAVQNGIPVSWALNPKYWDGPVSSLINMAKQQDVWMDPGISPRRWSLTATKQHPTAALPPLTLNTSVAVSQMTTPQLGHFR